MFAGDDDTPYRSFPAATAPGDVVVFFDVGAYSLEMMNPYNARPRAAAFAAQHGEVTAIRGADTLEDMIAADVAPDVVAAPDPKPAGRNRRKPDRD